MKIVHFADLHLDSAFAWAGPAANRRRENLRKTLKRIADRAQEVEAQALFCGGDLYEHERVSRDTAAFLRSTFAGLQPMRVFLAPGNHDWFGPESLYAAVDWPPNVHLFRTPRFEPVELADGLTLWGAAHCAPANTDNFLRDFRVEGPGAHLALFHGAELARLSEQGEGKKPHAAFDAGEIERAGFDHAFLGHYHRPKDAEFHTYPGNPDPLEFGETGERGAVIATIGADGRVLRERHVVRVTETHDLALDITGCASRQEVFDRLPDKVSGRRGYLRLRVSGDMDPSMDLNESHLESELDDFHAVKIDVGDIRPAYDIPTLREEQTVRGEFVRDVLSKELPSDWERRVLVTGLRALEGRDDLEVL